MNQERICRMLISATLMLAPCAFASTLYVGTCHTPSYNTISAAVVVAPAGAIIEVCPGTYAEQIAITQGITLKGISSNNSGQAIVIPPPNGMVANATDDMGDSIAAQLVVETDPTAVELSNLTFDASNTAVSAPAYIVGIFVRNSPATINHVVTQNQTGGNGGVGVWIEGGTSNPLVTLENSSIHDFSYIGIRTQTNAATPQLTAVVKGNLMNGDTVGHQEIVDVAIGDGSTATVTDNYLAGGQTGISVSGAASGTVSSNNLINDGTAIAVGGDGLTGGNVLVTSNNIFYSSVEGIVVYSGLPAIQRNIITHTPIGIDFACNGDGNMKTNTIMDTGIGTANLPVGFASTNSYFNVQTTTGATCRAATSRPSSPYASR